MTSDKLLPLLRDVVCLGLGAFGFIWQVTHGQADPLTMTGCILLLGGPAVIATWSLGRAHGGSATTGPSSPSPPPSPSPQLSSPSSSAGGEPA